VADETYAELLLRADNLEVALDSRGVISMAVGIIVHAEQIGPDDAFRTLVTRSQHQNRKLYDIAVEIVDRRAP